MGGKVRGQRFTAWLAHTDEGGDPTELVGMVVPGEDGGSDVRASVMDSRGAPTTALVLLAVAGIFALTGSSGVAWMLVGFAALVAAVAAFRDAKGLIDDGEATFLLAWLNTILDGIEAAGPAPTPLAGESNPTSPPMSVIGRAAEARVRE